MLKFITTTVVLGFQLTAVHGWAPGPTPDKSKLPPALDVAEKAWRFPATDINDKQKIPDDETYFDGHGTASMHWNHHSTAFVASSSKPAFVADTRGDPECDHSYHDGIGDTLCWVSSEVGEEHHYFDGFGTARWNKAPPATVVKPKATITSAPQDLSKEQELESEWFYFDGIGPAAYWPAPTIKASKVSASDDHHFFDGHGATIKWNDLLHVKHVQVKAPMLTIRNIRDGDCADFYYDETGDAICWATSSSNRVDRHYYDGVGETLQWGDIVHSMPASPKNVSVMASVEEDCEHKYFDGFDEMCWGP